MNRMAVSNSIVLTWTAVVDSSEVLLSLPSRVTGLIVSDNSCNDLIDLDLSRFENVKNVEIGSNALKNIKNLTMNGLNGLIRFGVGSGSLNGVEIVSIGSNSLNSISSFNFSLFSNVKVIEIGHESMNQVVNVTANRLGMLQNVRIDDDSLKNTTK